MKNSKHECCALEQARYAALHELIVCGIAVILEAIKELDNKRG